MLHRQSPRTIRKLIFVLDSTYSVMGLLSLVYYVGVCSFFQAACTLAGAIYVGLIIQAVYLFNRVYEAPEDLYDETKDRVEFLMKYEKPLMLIVVLFLLIAEIIGILFFKNIVLGVSLPVLAFLVGVTYTHRRLKLKKRLFVKGLFFPSLFAFVPVLTVVGMSYPALFEVPSNFEQKAFLVIGFTLAELYVNANFFDLKDVIPDRLNRIRTIPVVYGPKRGIKIVSLLNYLKFGVFTLLSILCGISLRLSLFMVLGGLILVLYYYALIESYRKNYLPQKVIFGVLGDLDVLWLAFIFYLGSKL